MVTPAYVLYRDGCIEPAWLYDKEFHMFSGTLPSLETVHLASNTTGTAKSQISPNCTDY